MQNFTKKDLTNNKEITHVYTVQTTREGKPVSLPHCDLFGVGQGRCIIDSYFYSLFYFINQLAELSQSDNNWLTVENINSITPGLFIVNHQYTDIFNRIKHYSPPARTIDQLHFYDVRQCYDFSLSLKKSIEILKLAQHHSLNPIENTSQLQPLLQSLNQIGNFGTYSLNHHPLEQQILQLLIPMANYVFKKINVAQTKVLGENFHYNNLDIKILTNKIVKNPTNSLEVTLSPTVNTQLISQLLDQTKFLKFFENISKQNLYHVFVLDDLARDEIEKIKNQAKSSMDKKDYRIASGYVACKTDDFHLILKLLIPGKFSYIDVDTMNAIRKIL